MAKTQRITIKEIAEEAGVSKQTVSRVLNDRPDVSPETRARVKLIIDARGYQPSELALGLVRGRTSTIGVISSDLQFSGPFQTLAGIQEQANLLGYSISLSLLRNSTDKNAEAIFRKMNNQRVAGIVWAPVSKVGNTRNRILDELVNSEIPIVARGRPYPGLTVIDIDNYSTGKMATTHLIEQGYSTIGIITGPLEDWSADQRLKGWQDTLKSANMPQGKNVRVEGDWTAASGAEGLEKLLRQEPRIDAVFVSNDQMALGTLSTAHNLGKRVPHDIGIVGCDDIPEAKFFTPSLTTIRLDLIQAGRLLIEELDCIIRAQSLDEICDPQTVVIPPQLQVRESSVVNTTLEIEARSRL